jgi:hypothetical protein
MMLLDRPAFVLERRINQPLRIARIAMSTETLLPQDAEFALGSDGRLHVDQPLRMTVGSYTLSWRAQARLLNGRGHRVARVELEVDAWSNDATRLQLRPVARHPERWSAQRLRRYFVLAHRAADHTASRLNEIANTPQLHPVSQRVGVPSR